MGVRGAVLASLLSSFAVQPAAAGVYSDDLSKCLVAQTSDADRATFMRWFFGAMSVSPTVKDLAAINEDENRKSIAATADLFEVLLTERCRKESIAAIKYEGASAIEASFNMLGQIASLGLMSNPAVQAELKKLGDEFDNEKLMEMIAESGRPAQVP